MNATAQRFVGTWTGEHQAGLATITIALQVVDDALSGTWVVTPGSLSEQSFTPLQVAIVNPKIDGERLSFLPPQAPTALCLRLTGDKEAVFEPLLDLSRFDLSDPELCENLERGVAGHRIILAKIC
jgi:hypothetical protein